MSQVDDGRLVRGQAVPDKVYITRQDLVRLRRVLEAQDLPPAAFELHSLADLEPTIEGIEAVISTKRMFGCPLTVNPGLAPGAFRWLPKPMFRAGGRMAEWNVREWGPVPATLDVYDRAGVKTLQLG